MKVYNGTRPTWRNNKDFDFHKTFGTAVTFPTDFSVDKGLTMPDQNSDGNYFECTDYTTNDIGTDLYGIVFTNGRLFAKTLLMEGQPWTTQGADIRSALKAAKVYGLLPFDKTPQELQHTAESFNADYRHWPVALDAIASEYRLGDLFNIQPLNGEWFDGIRSAIFTNNLPVTIGTPWYSTWENIGSDGICSTIPTGTPSGWHNWKIAGWKTVNGVPYLLAKTWQGNRYGDNGWSYYPREVINALWKIYGVQAFTIAKAEGKDIQSIKFDMLETIKTFLARIVHNLTA